MDREKVIEGLDEVREYIMEKVHGIASRKCRMMDKVDNAIALMKEQEAVEPKWASGIKGGSDALCGSCMSWLSDHSWGYCPRCGKQVAWND